MKTRTLDDVLSEFRNLNADQIAAMVKRRGIKGRMGTTYGCPMALLLGGANTGEFIIGRRYVARKSGGKIEQVRTPRSVIAFVRKFDIGGYPELIAPPPRCVAQVHAEPRKGGPGGSPQKRTPRVIRNHVAKMVERFA